MENVLRRFIYNMIMHPEMQKQAQAEIDEITEGRRLPTLDELVIKYPPSLSTKTCVSNLSRL